MHASSLRTVIKVHGIPTRSHSQAIYRFWELIMIIYYNIIIMLCIYICRCSVVSVQELAIMGRKNCPHQSRHTTLAVGACTIIELAISMCTITKQCLHTCHATTTTAPQLKHFPKGFPLVVMYVSSIVSTSP